MKPFFFFVLLALFGRFSAASATIYLPIDARGFYQSGEIALNKLSQYDSESESDALAYKPVACRIQSVLNDSVNNFCYSAGSLSSKKFLIDNYMNITKPAVGELDFRFQWNREQTIERDANALNFEFLQAVHQNHVFGAFGALSTDKSQDDAGVSYNYFGSKNQKLRLQATAFDYDRNERNAKSDRFIDEPVLYTVSYSQILKASAIYLQVSIEPEFTWDTTAQILRRESTSVELAYRIEDVLVVYEHLNEEVSVDASSESLGLHRFHFQKKFYEFLYGARLAVRSFESAAMEKEFYDFLPFFWFETKKIRRLRTGYEMTIHSSPDSKDKVQHRGNLGWSLIKNKDTRFELLFSFDLDRLGSETWEGGRGYLTTVF